MNEREELIMVIAMAVSYAYPPIVQVDDEGAINVDANRLSQSILDAGYRK